MTAFIKANGANRILNQRGTQTQGTESECIPSEKKIRLLDTGSSQQPEKLQKSCEQANGDIPVDAKRKYIYDVIRSYNKTFDKPVVSSCSVDQSSVQVRIAVDGCVEKSLSEHQEELSEKLEGYRVDVVQLSQPVVYQPTHGPGQLVTLRSYADAIVSCYIKGAGEQRYALLAGHNRQVNEEIVGNSISGGHPEQVGKITNVILEGDSDTRFCDVAVAELTTKETLPNHILDDKNKCFHLDVAAGEEGLVNGLVQQVQLFTNRNVKRQQVKLNYFEGMDNGTAQLKDCVEVSTKGHQQIQEDGQSGVLLTSIVDEHDPPNVVKGLVLLTGKINTNEGFNSIGQSLSYTLERIRSEENFTQASLIEIKKCRANCQAAE